MGSRGWKQQAANHSVCSHNFGLQRAEVSERFDSEGDEVLILKQQLLIQFLCNIYCSTENSSLLLIEIVLFLI